MSGGRRVTHGPIYLGDGITTGGGFFASATGAPNRKASDLVQLSIGQVVVGVMGKNEIHDYLLDRRQVCDLIVALADALIELENRKAHR